MQNLCSCTDWAHLAENDYDVFSYSAQHNKWIISWLVLTKQGVGYKADRYGLIIKYCPFCGQKLKT